MKIISKIVLLSIVCLQIQSERNKKQKNQTTEESSSSQESADNESSCFRLKDLDKSVFDIYPSLKKVDL